MNINFILLLEGSLWNVQKTLYRTFGAKWTAVSNLLLALATTHADVQEAERWLHDTNKLAVSPPQIWDSNSLYVHNSLTQCSNILINFKAHMYIYTVAAAFRLSHCQAVKGAKNCSGSQSHHTLRLTTALRKPMGEFPCMFYTVWYL